MPLFFGRNLCLLLALTLLALGTGPSWAAGQDQVFYLRLGDGAPQVAEDSAKPPAPAAPAQAQAAPVSLLVRELCRQALLISARGRLHLRTRDEALGEVWAGKAWSLQVERRGEQLLLTLTGPDGDKAAALWQGQVPFASSQPDYLQLAVATEILARQVWPAVLIKAGFVPGVAAAPPAPGTPGADAAAAADAAVPAVVVEQLQQMNYLAQFAAVRWAEQAAATRAEEENSAAVQGLRVRAYANLGQLVRHQSQPAAQVYLARALLYAQAMVARAPQDAKALNHRAYALALIGLPDAALEDLRQAALLAPSVSMGPPAPHAGSRRSAPDAAGAIATQPAAGPDDSQEGPTTAPADGNADTAPANAADTADAAAADTALAVAAAATQAALDDPALALDDSVWPDLLDAYCREDRYFLQAYSVKGQSDYRLARLLTLLQSQNTLSPALIQSSAQRVLEDDPDCLLAVELLLQDATMARGHRLTMLAPELMRTALFRRLPQLPGLPQQVADLLAAQTPAEAEKDLHAAAKGIFDVQAAALSGRSDFRLEVVAICDQTGRGGDGGEPSLSALASLLADANFLHLFRRAQFLRTRAHSDAGPLLEQQAGFWQQHPLRQLLQSFAVPVGQGPAALLAKLAPADLSARGLLAAELLQAPPQLASSAAKDQAQDLLDAILARSDDVVPDLAWRYRHSRIAAQRLAVSALLRRIHRHSPLPLAACIESDWPRAVSQLAQADKSMRLQPAVLAALARRELAKRQWRQAMYYLEACRQVAPDPWVARALADLYRATGQGEKYVQVLEAQLAASDVLEEQSQLKVLIAGHRMSRGQFSGLASGLEEAARTRTPEALVATADCYTGLGDFVKAQYWARRNSQINRGQELQWYLWCKRTGQGDVAAARALAEKALAGPPPADQASQAERRRMQATLELLEGRHAQAWVYCWEDFRLSGDIRSGMLAALLAPERDGERARQAVLGAVLAQAKLLLGDAAPPTQPADAPEDFTAAALQQWQTSARLLLELVGQWRLATPKQQLKLDLEQWDKALAALPVYGRIETCYFAASMLLAQGQRDQAQHLLRLALSPVTEPPGYFQTLTFQLARELGDDPLALAKAAASSGANTPAPPAETPGKRSGAPRAPR